MRAIICALFIMFPTIASAAPFIDHNQACADWTDVAIREYATYKTKYNSTFYFGPSQENVEVAAAKARGWTAESIASLKDLIAEAQNGKWQTLDSFSRYIHDRCLSNWRATTTQAQREAEVSTISSQRAADQANGERIQEKIRHDSACRQYQMMARQIFAYKNNGYSYDEASRKAAEAAYGPGGIALQFSEQNADAYMMLAAAIYFEPQKYGKTDNEIIQKALDLCMAGKLLDAS